MSNIGSSECHSNFFGLKAYIPTQDTYTNNSQPLRAALRIISGFAHYSHRLISHGSVAELGRTHD